ncbi:MAG: hypothetical protein ACK5TK_10100 [Betaproteobacteria bacterium]
MSSTRPSPADHEEAFRALDDDAVLLALGEAAFAPALDEWRRTREEFAARTAAAVRAAMQAELARRQ